MLNMNSMDFLLEILSQSTIRDTHATFSRHRVQPSNYLRSRNLDNIILNNCDIRRKCSSLKWSISPLILYSSDSIPKVYDIAHFAAKLNGWLR